MSQGQLKTHPGIARVVAGTAGVPPANSGLEESVASFTQTVGETPAVSVMTPAVSSTRLSTTDAFFVAYQERSGILMQLCGEVDLAGPLERQHLEQMILHIVRRWPRLGQRLKRNVFGLKWAGTCRVDEMLRVASDTDAGGGLTAWRNEPVDPFRDPPFQVLWIPPRAVGPREGGVAHGDSHTISFRAHHAVMDGESLIAVTADAVPYLAQISIGKHVPTPPPAPAATLKDLISVKQLARRRRWSEMFRYTRWLAAEARAARSARVDAETFAIGDTHLCERRLDSDALARLKRRAKATRTGASWLSAAAWMRAIYAWNTRNGALSDENSAVTSNPIISLEFPVSLRRGLGGESANDGHDLLGNFISPLIVFGDATEPLEQLARKLRKQVMQGIRSQSHLGTPLLTAPAKFLPWSMFRRVAVSPQTTGFATSHFTWFEQADACANIARVSDGALRVTGQRIYTPVCLHMGAALVLLASSDYAQIFLTYRETAFSADAAERLIDLMVAELEGDSGDGETQAS